MTNEVSRGGNPNWKAGCPSPNPAGRPKGIVDKRARATQALVEQTTEIVQVILAAAMRGDMQAASLVLSKVLPSMKAQAERVTFDMDPDASLTQQAQSVVAAIAAGQISADIGKSIIEAITALFSLRQIDELARRIDALEGKQ